MSEEMNREEKRKPVALDMPDEEILYDVADLFKTFGDTTRIKILYALMDSEMCVCDIAELLDVSAVGRVAPAPGH